MPQNGPARVLTTPIEIGLQGRSALSVGLRPRRERFSVGAGRPSAKGPWRPNSFGTQADHRPQSPQVEFTRHPPRQASASNRASPTLRLISGPTNPKREKLLPTRLPGAPAPPAPHRTPPPPPRRRGGSPAAARRPARGRRPGSPEQKAGGSAGPPRRPPAPPAPAPGSAAPFHRCPGFCPKEGFWVLLSRTAVEVRPQPHLCASPPRGQSRSPPKIRKRGPKNLEVFYARFAHLFARMQL